MGNTLPAPATRKVLFHVVDVAGRPLSGANVEYFINGKKIASIKVGTQPGTVEPAPTDDVHFIAHYEGYEPRRQKPDLQDRCIIHFPEVNLQSPPSRPAPQVPVGVNLIIIFVFVLGLAFIAAGIWMASQVGDTTVDILGMKISTKNAGVACVFLGAVVIIIIFRKALNIMRDLFK